MLKAITTIYHDSLSSQVVLNSFGVKFGVMFILQFIAVFAPERNTILSTGSDETCQFVSRVSGRNLDDKSCLQILRHLALKFVDTRRLSLVSKFSHSKQQRGVRKHFATSLA